MSNVLENGIFVCVDTIKKMPPTTALRLVHKSVQIFALSGRPRTLKLGSAARKKERKIGVRVYVVVDF